MSHDPPTTFLGLPIGAKRRVDAACLAFERAGPGASIEEHLGAVEPELRDVLLTELVALDIERRRGAGEHPEATEYARRFPDRAAAVRAAFGSLAPAVGDLLGRYRLTGVIGRGGMGVVFEAADPVIDRKVAIKVLPGTLSGDPLARERLLSEARLAGQLLHPNVVAVFEAGETDGVAFLVLERVSGGSAADRIKRDGALPWRLAVRIATDACRGLVAIHDAGFLHLDVKPGNILLPESTGAPDGSVSSGVLAKLADFSLSTADAAPRLTGATAGTPAYMSPEQRDGGELTRRTDVFGLGATLFALLTGAAPYPGATVTDVIAEQFRRPAPDPRELNPRVPDAVARVVRRAMSVRPGERHSSAGELLGALEQLLAPPRRWREGFAALAGAGAMLAVAVGVSVLLTGPRDARVAPGREFARVDAWEPLLDEHDLGLWQPVVPEGGSPIGAGPRSEFSLVLLDGAPALRATGTGLGSVESAREFENFHLRFEYRWGAADGDHYASVRYHCTGPVGSKGTHGMQLHLQRAGSYLRRNDLLRVDIGAVRGERVEPVRPGGQRIDTEFNTEAPVGRWNKAALVCVGDWSVHVINGAPVLALARSRWADPPDEPLTRGRIRFQSVKGEIFFRKIEIRRATALPPEYQRPGE
ncbi:MAG TPA: protein kinase [Gemmata sp.]